jgi:hypothetical protein
MIVFTLICFFLSTVNQFDFFLLKATLVPCKTTKNKFENCFVSSLCAWCNVCVWDELIGDVTIMKEVQMNQGVQEDNDQHHCSILEVWFWW